MRPPLLVGMCLELVALAALGGYTAARRCWRWWISR